MGVAHSLKKMSVEEFLDWQTKQERLYELVDGMPFLSLKAMTGASSNHDTVTVNALGLLFNRLKGTPCRPRTQDIAVKIPAGNVRRPDVLVECGTPGPRDMTAVEPRLVIEVLSPSTMQFDRFRKLEEYRTVPELQVILLVDTEAPQVVVHRRVEGQWTVAVIENIDASIALDEIDAALPMRDLYEGVQFAEGSQS
jgi:Uma2 family endonuclease